jgi:DeoR/GlpR family transcriptional regulator of sugar metabolism
MNQIRQEKIKQYIQSKEIVSIKELKALCPDVSHMTIHRDLDTLEASGEIIKVRGGARSINHSIDPVHEERLKENISAKAIIAQKALTLIQPNTSIFFDSGTTILAIAKALPDIGLTVFTTGPNIAIELRHLSMPSINLCCGNFNRSTLALSGHNTLKMLEEINIDFAFIGVSGCSIDTGFTCGQENEMMVKQLVIKKARTSVIVFDSTKLTRLMPYTFARIEDVDYIISDNELPEDFQKAAKEANVIIF